MTACLINHILKAFAYRTDFWKALELQLYNMDLPCPMLQVSACHDPEQKEPEEKHDEIQFKIDERVLETQNWR